MATRRDTRSAPSSTSDFGKMGGDVAESVVDVSGAPSPNTRMVPRPNTITAPPPSRALRHRRPIEVDAQSGEQLDHDLGQRLTAAAQSKASIKATVDQHPPGLNKDLEMHVFGLNLGRDRA